MDMGDESVGADNFLDLKRMLKALGDVVRLAMISVLVGSGEITVTDLGELLASHGRFVSQPLVSWHISQLRRAGFVRTRRMGRQVYCSLDMGRYQRCLHMLGDLVAESRVADLPRPSTARTGRAAPTSGATERGELQTT